MTHCDVFWNGKGKEGGKMQGKAECGEISWYPPLFEWKLHLWYGTSTTVCLHP